MSRAKRNDKQLVSATPLLSVADIGLLSQGKHTKPYQCLGAHLTSAVINGKTQSGCTFSVWAPNARSVAVIGDFNHWQGEQHCLNNIGDSGYWSLFVAGVKQGALYKFQIITLQGEQLADKADPFAVQMQYRPDTASVVSSEPDFAWQDQAWLAKRGERNRRDAAISIYEVHLGSWRRGADNEFLNYRTIADQLIPYVLDMGFTHIQLLPISEHPFDGSWGYQPVGLFAPSARFGNASDFQYFIDQCHQAEIGVLIDWVPGHFPNDAHGLVQFDGSHLYEHHDLQKGFHPDWNTLIYNYESVQVTNFLRASAMHWLDRFHVDGIRVDAVASMLYLDYSRGDGQWTPNIHGGRENLEAVEFLQHFNEELYLNYPGTFSVAEESTSWPGVSAPTHAGGLGFGFKWNMGWMNDSLRYMQREAVHRQHHHQELTFGLVYAFNENFVLPLSHDEVVHGKGSLIAKMPGDAWQQFANLRAYFGFMWAHPGKKLLFMGGEFAQGKEWNHDQELDWHQLDIHWHSGVQKTVKALNNLYRTTPALHQKDCQSDGFLWLDHQNAQQSIYSFIRFGESGTEPVIVICNFTEQCHHHFDIGVPSTGDYHEIFNSDLQAYGGSDQQNLSTLSSQNKPYQGQPHRLTITVPPLSTLMFALKETDGRKHKEEN
ncbi:1,4-alpha-glucan branching protein GlgB [Thalassotalea sp. PLHSN55]|uniref:1,4-alpha-glucan branching protein GlgB n=1 Tax=Thalassotalea sp. PLHSN55 TaxID=3435888 RepID=UPI003F85F15F